MSFLAPWFLLGTLAVALPVVFHLIRRTTRERTTFSSLMFLQTSPPRLTRRSRLEHWLLLLLRCAVIGLLAFGFARPFLKQLLSEPVANSSKRTLVLVDVSASMRRGNLWDQARRQAESIARQASLGDQVAFYTFGRQLKPLIPFSEWKATQIGNRLTLVRSRLANLSPGWSDTALGQALVQAADRLADADEKQTDGPRQIVLISDLQAGSRLASLQAYDWPKGVTVRTVRLTPPSTSNAGLQWATGRSEPDQTAPMNVRVRVSNAADSKREQFRVGWASQDGKSLRGKPVELYVPAGQSRIVSVPVLETNGAPERLMLQGDQEPFDNTVYVVPPEQVHLTVLYLGTETETNTRQPLFFLRCAFQDTPRQTIRIHPVRPSTPLTARQVDAATLIIATDSLSPTTARTLRQAVTHGQTFLFVPKNSTAAATLAPVLGLDHLTVADDQPKSYAMLGDIDFQHPLFAPFADARFSDFTKIHFWSYRRFDLRPLPTARVLARFDDGDPAIAEFPLDQGRVLVFASGWAPADSQLALSSKFVPLLYSVLALSGKATPPPAQYFVGDAVPLPASGGLAKTAATIREPDGSTVTLPTGQTSFTQTLVPGFYTVTSARPPRHFVVNLDAAESRTAPLPADVLERYGVPVPGPALDARRVAEQKVRLRDTQLEARQKLWRWFLVATLAVLLVETWLAGWTARRTAAQGEVSV